MTKSGKKKYDKARWKRKRHDIDYKLIRNLKHSVRDTARESGIKIKLDPFKLLGCTIEEFKVYISELFYSANGVDMDWNNYGGKEGWQLDHIQPLDSFDLSNEDDLRLACHLSNIQPLFAFDNKQKHNSTDWIHPTEETPF